MRTSIQGFIPSRFACCAALLAAGTLSAAPTTGAETASLDSLANELSSSCFAEREAATVRLLEDTSISQADLLRLCMATDSPELRRRGLAIHRARFFASPRPAIGVTFAAAGGLPMIERVHNGFPAAENGALRHGDIIVAVAGIKLNPMPTLARDELRPLVFSHDPFDTVRLTVYRPQNPEAQARLLAEIGGVNGIPSNVINLTDCPDGYDTVETDVQLGEYSMLETTLALNELERTRAWNALLMRSGFENEISQNFRDTSDPRNVAFHGRQIQPLDIRFPFFTRGSYFPADEHPTGYRNQAVIAKQIHNMAIRRVQVHPPDMVNGRPNRGITVESVQTNGNVGSNPQDADLTKIAREIAQTQARIAELSRLVSEPASPIAERRAAEQTIEVLRDRLNTLRERLSEAAS